MALEKGSAIATWETGSSLPCPKGLKGHTFTSGSVLAMMSRMSAQFHHWICSAVPPPAWGNYPGGDSQHSWYLLGRGAETHRCLAGERPKGSRCYLGHFFFSLLHLRGWRHHGYREVIHGSVSHFSPLHTYFPPGWSLFAWPSCLSTGMQKTPAF